jgi:hypothetical protein
MPEISDEELAKLKANEESVKKLEEKNKELLAEKQAEAKKREDAEKLVKQKEEEELKAKNDYKTLFEKSEADRIDREAKEKERSEKLSKGAKLSKIQEELVKLGINGERIPHALRLVELEGVKYDEATNAVTGADAAANKIKMSLPELFVKKDKERTAGGESGEVVPESMTLEWYNALPEADKKKHYKAFMKAQGHEIR